MDETVIIIPQGKPLRRLHVKEMSSFSTPASVRDGYEAKSAIFLVGDCFNTNAMSHSVVDCKK